MIRVFSLSLVIGLQIPVPRQALNSPAVVAAVPDGTRLALGDFCYTLTAAKNGAEQPVGYVFQSIRREQSKGGDELAVVVHQHLNSGKFDMRDTLLLDRADLRPIRLDTIRDGAPHVHLDYVAGEVIGWKMVKGAKQAIDVKFDGPLWDGNLWGLTFAALPLQDGGSYRLPTYQYDTGKGNFLVNVTGHKRVDTPMGAVTAWALEAGIDAKELVAYWVGGTPSMELGYAAGPMSQRLGGECVGLN